GPAANREFKFQQVTLPSRDDRGAQARMVLIDGRLDPNGADLNALIDGRLPADEDEPGANLFLTPVRSAVAFAWTGTLPSRSPRSTPTRGIQIRARRSFISSMAATAPQGTSMVRRNAASIHRPAA